MKESDFVDAYDLCRLRIINTLLREIIPGLRPGMSKKDHVATILIVEKWLALIEEKRK